MHFQDDPSSLSILSIPLLSSLLHVHISTTCELKSYKLNKQLVLLSLSWLTYNNIQCLKEKPGPLEPAEIKFPFGRQLAN